MHLLLITNLLIKTIFLSFITLLDFVINQNLLQRFTPKLEKNSFSLPKINFDIYSTINSKKVIMLIHGLTPEGKDDSRLIEVAEKLARIGFIVVVPEFEGIKKLNLGLNEINEINYTLKKFIYLFPTQKKGVMAFSYSAGITIIAASYKEIENSLEFMILWGSYANMKKIVKYILTGYYLTDNKKIYREPPKAVLDIFIHQNINYLPIDKQKDFVIAWNNPDYIKFLDNETKNIYLFLKNTIPEKFDYYYNNLPDNIKKRLELLSADKHIEKFDCKILFVHPLNDPVIPHYESEILYSISKSKNKKIFFPEIFSHVDMEIKDKGVIYALKLLFNFYLIIFNIANI